MASLPPTQGPPVDRKDGLSLQPEFMSETLDKPAAWSLALDTQSHNVGKVAAVGGGWAEWDLSTT